MNRPTTTPVYMLFLTWVLLFPLLFFSARGMFSFDRAQYANNAAVDAVHSTASDSDTAYFRVERFGVYALVMAAMAFSFRSTLRACRRNPSVFALPAIAFLSVLWSQDRVKTLPLAILAFCLTAFSVYLSQRFPKEKTLDLFNVVGITTVVISYFLVLFVPSIGIRTVDPSNAWQGMYVHKNSLGLIMVFFFATAYYTEHRSALRRFFHTVYLAAIVMLIVMCQSRTAWIQFFLLLCYFLFESLYIRVGKQERGIAVATVALAAAAIVTVVVNYGGSIALALGKTSDMTGRAGIFEALYPVLWKRPVFGFGYQAFWLGLRGESANVFLNTGTANAENGILQMWLELGAIGTGVMVLLLLRSFLSGMICLARAPSRFVRWNCSIIFLSLLSAMNGDKFMYPDTIEWVLFVLAYVNLTEEVRRTRVDAVEVGSLAWAS